MSDLLPYKALEHVKDLTLKLGHRESEPLWPESWDQLTSITRLEMNWQKPDGVYFLPPVRLQSLKDVKFVLTYKLFDNSGEEYVNSLFGCLPLLSRIQVTIQSWLNCAETAAGSPAAENADTERKRVKAICVAIESCTPGLKHTIVEEPGKKTWLLLVVFLAVGICLAAFNL